MESTLARLMEQRLRPDRHGDLALDARALAELRRALQPRLSGPDAAHAAAELLELIGRLRQRDQSAAAEALAELYLELACTPPGDLGPEGPPDTLELGSNRAQAGRLLGLGVRRPPGA